MVHQYVDRLSLPWTVDHRESYRFWLILAVIAVILLPMAIVIPGIDLPERDREQLEKLPPQLAKILVEKKEIEKPKPEPKKEEKPKEEPKPEPKKEEKPKEEPKPEPPKPKIEKPKPKPTETEVKKAREKAKKSGLLALQSELADMQNMVDTQQLAKRPQSVVKTIAATANAIDQSNVSRTSGGIAQPTDAPVETVALASREVTELEKTEDDIALEKAVAKAEAQGRQRSDSNIKQVFDKNKSSLFRLYNRALRKDPSLQGTVVLKFTIEPDGSVSDCSVVSSDLKDEDLVGKIVNRVKLINFGEQKVSAKTITFPIEFFPS